MINTGISPTVVSTVALAVAFIVGILIPLLTELITHATAPMWIRSALNFGLSAVAGILITVTITDYTSISDYILAIASAWVATMRSHYAGLANPVALKTANFGIGAQSKVGTLP